MIVRPFKTDYDLDSITKAWKGVSAREINKFTGGPRNTVWQDESFDTIIRDAEHLYQAIQYVGRNPSKANLEGKCIRWLCPEWEKLGYGFTEKF